MKEEIMDYLVCPVCKSEELQLNKKKILEDRYIFSGRIVCKKCKRIYPIINGLPILLIKDRQKEAIASFNPDKETLEYTLIPTKKIANLVRQTKSNFVLDCGCGSGAYTKFFNGKVIYFDINPYFLKELEKKEGNEALLVVADITNLPFKENIFDFVFASSIIEHLKSNEIENTLRDLENVTSNNGIVQIDLPNSSNSIESLHAMLSFFGVYNSRIIAKENPELMHHSFFISKDLTKQGFEVHGCIGWVTRLNIKLGVLWDIYDIITWYLPNFAGTLIGIKRVHRI
jgi:uncharacterized protein YbaR (Trm112 family)